MTTWISREDLEIDRSRSIGRGGTSEGIWRCRTPAGEPRLFKEYNDQGRSLIDDDALDAHIRWLTELSPADRATVDSFAAWPQLRVTDGSGTVGVVIAEAPPSCIEDRRRGPTPRDLEALARNRTWSAERGLAYYPVPQKLARLGHLLEMLAFFHGHDVVVGDLQVANVLTTGLSDSRTVYFLDCDSWLLGGRSPMPPMNPLSWKADHLDDFSAKSDMYKAALLVVRCLAEDLSVRSTAAVDLSEWLPSREVAVLEGLLTGRAASVTSRDFLPTAEVWQSLAASDESSFVHNDRFVRAPWNDATPSPTRPKTDRAAVPSFRPELPPPPVDGPPPGPGGYDTNPPPPGHRRRRLAIAAAAVVVTAVLVVAGIVISDRRNNAAAPAAAPVSSSRVVRPTHSTPVRATTHVTRTPTTTGPRSTAPPTSTAPPDPQAAALAELERIRANDVSQVPLDGQWAIELDSKYPGITDSQQVAANGSHTFEATDILADYQRLHARFGNVVLLKSTDFHTKWTGPPLWVTLETDSFGSEADANQWCSDQFGPLSSSALADLCYPATLDPP